MMSFTNMDKCFREICFVLICVLVYECYGLKCRSGSDNKEHELKRVYDLCQSKYFSDKLNNSATDSSKEWFGVPNYRRTANYNFHKNQKPKEETRNRFGIELDSERQWRDEQNMEHVRSNEDKVNANGDRFHIARTDMFAAPIDEKVGNRPSYTYTGIGKAHDKNSFGFWNNYKVNDKDIESIVDFDGPRDDIGDADYVRKLYTHNDELVQSRSERDKDRLLRFKRSRPGHNRGSRSQYNPNGSLEPSTTIYNDAGNDEIQNQSNNSKVPDKACALHCYLENLGMTTSDGLVDKYLVINVLTRDIKSEDLKDFLVESIEECFQLLENEYTEDKCKLSKALLFCLSEKGRANCDDWQSANSFRIKSMTPQFEQN